MYETLLTLITLAATGLAAWLYWQVQHAQAHIREQESVIREKAILVGELADEIAMATLYLYEAMDHCLAELEAQKSGDHPVDLEIEEPSRAYQAQSIRPAPPAEDISAERTAEAESSHTVAAADVAHPYHPHFDALKLAAQGIELLEIARHTGLGVEELRLLLRFQEELSVAG